VLASLLPGLRDLRTPLAVGYLWLLGLWLLLYRRVPTSIADAPEGPIKAIYQLSSLLGQAVILAALSFVAYLLGSMLRLQSSTNLGKLVRTRIDSALLFVTRYLPVVRKIHLPFTRQSELMYSQLEIFVGARLRETASGLTGQDHVNILRRFFNFPQWRGEDHVAIEWLARSYTDGICADFEAVGIQLQAKNRDFWDTYDREVAEAQFRYGIAPPLVLIIALVAVEAGSGWWLFLLAAPALLLYRSRQHSYRAASTLVQAIVLKMVEPPLLEKLSAAVAKKQEEKEREQQQKLSRSRPIPYTARENGHRSGEGDIVGSVTEQAPAPSSPTENG